MIKLYSTGCPKCNVLKKKLDAAQINYTVIEDMDAIMAVCNELKVDTVPILEVELNEEVSEFMEFPQAVKWVGEQNG